MIKRPDCLMSDNGKYCIMGNDGMIKNIYDGEIQVVDVSLYDSNTDALLVDENGNLIIVGKVITDI